MKKNKHLGSWIGAGACFALSILLLGISYPKQGRIDQCAQEIERLTPIVEDIRRQSGSQEKPKDGGKLDAELRAQLPQDDEFLEFHLMVKKCAIESGVADLGYYTMGLADYWPPKPGADKPTNGDARIPDKYNERGGDKSELRRYPLELDFETDYATLNRFVSRLQQLPRFSQIVSLQLQGPGAKIRVLLRIEAYSTAVPQ